ncbi:MAG: T9SS type A sorting domain-containing protein, partial [Flavobacteriaceae bacterium]|nr:T9SS type A sorting domain-containing protein [Flavobacteriaceae bacterium]
VGTQLPEGTYTVSITVEDASGNSESCNFQLVVDEVLGVNDTEELATLKLVPNPTSDSMNLLQSGTLQIESIAIYELSGRLLLEEYNMVSSSEISLDVSLLPSATYLVKVETDRGVWIQQLIKE